MKNLYYLNLHLFGEGGAEGVGTNAGANEGYTSEVDTDDNDSGYDAGTVDTPVDKAKQFEELINGEYADEFNAAHQKRFNGRYAEMKKHQERADELQGQLDGYGPIVDMMRDKYGIDDPVKLLEAMTADDSLFEAEGAEDGMSGKAKREFLQMKRQNEKVNAWLEAENREKAIRENQRILLARADEVKATFPDFDLARELKNPEFEKRVKAGMDMEEAYKLIHYDELITGAIKTAKSKAAEEVVSNITARGKRPRENGTGKGVPGNADFSINNLTLEQREILDYAIQRGERDVLSRIPEILTKYGGNRK